jgi:hypothetical protein
MLGYEKEFHSDLPFSVFFPLAVCLAGAIYVNVLEPTEVLDG